MPRNIAQVFNFTHPVDSNQSNNRSYVERQNVRSQVRDSIFGSTFSVIAGYSGVGKTTLINQAINQLRAERNLYVVRVSGADLRGQDPLHVIYNAIPDFLRNNLPAVTDQALADLISTRGICIFLDSINAIFDDKDASEGVCKLGKSWTSHSGNPNSSKIILEAYGSPNIVEQWFQEMHDTRHVPRFPKQIIEVPGWSQSEIVELIETGAKLLEVNFEPLLVQEIQVASCGLPVTATLLSNIAVTNANNSQQQIPQDIGVLDVYLDDLQNVLHATRHIQNVVRYRTIINRINDTALLLLYKVGSELGVYSKEDLKIWLSSLDIPNAELALAEAHSELIENELVFFDEDYSKYHIEELSYGTIAYTRLLFRSKLATGQHIRAILEKISSNRYQKGISEVSLPITIFLNYTRTNQAQVETIYDFLESRGYTPWMDSKDIHGGQDWDRAIKQAIHNATFFIACLSTSSANRRGVLQQEIKEALDRWDGMLLDDIYLIPLKLEHCDIPSRLQHLQAINWFESDGKDRLVKAIQKGLEIRKL